MSASALAGNAPEDGAENGATRDPGIDSAPDLAPAVVDDDEEVLIEEVDPPEDDKGDDTDRELRRIEKEKKGMSAVEKLERSSFWKAEGNTFFKSGDLIKACDAYYHAVLFCRDLTQNPQYYPNLGHTQEQRQLAKDLCESTFTNLALVQCKYGTTTGDLAERSKVLQESIKSASEALKLNDKNVKALYRRAHVRAILSRSSKSNAEAQELGAEAKNDLLAALEIEPNNRDARAELKAVQERAKVLKREELNKEKKSFGFANTLSGLGTKEKDLLGDGSIRKQIVKCGDGGNWLNKDWLPADSSTKCVVQVLCALVGNGGDGSCGSKAKSADVSFVLGDPGMHTGFDVAVQSMTLGEVAHFVIDPSRLSGRGTLVDVLPCPPPRQATTWELTFQKFTTWDDINRDGEKLQKVYNEGYGPFATLLSEVHLHWRVAGPDGGILHSSRYTLGMGGESGLQQVEDEDKQAAVHVLGEDLWEPLAILCRSLRQGGVGELRLRHLPALPKDEGSGASAQVSMLISKMKKSQALEHCTVRVELERVVLPLSGPEDPRWEGPGQLIQERFRAAQLIEQGEDTAALARLRRVVEWADRLPDESGFGEHAAEAKATIGWVLASRAAPILDLGNVTSTMLAVANRDIEEAQEICKWLVEHRPGDAGTLLLRAKLAIAQDDAFREAFELLQEASRLAPNDKRVEEELKKVRVEVRKEDEAQLRQNVIRIRDDLKRVRLNSNDTRDAAVKSLLQELALTSISWDVVMDTRIGVEVQSCQEACGEDCRKLCSELLGRFKDESKMQRPLWNS